MPDTIDRASGKAPCRASAKATRLDFIELRLLIAATESNASKVTTVPLMPPKTSEAASDTGKTDAAICSLVRTWISARLTAT